MPRNEFSKFGKDNVVVYIEFSSKVWYHKGSFDLP